MAASGGWFWHNGSADEDIRVGFHKRVFTKAMGRGGDFQHDTRVTTEENEAASVLVTLKARRPLTSLTTEAEGRPELAYEENKASVVRYALLHENRKQKRC